MARNKVIFGNEVLIDLTGDTVAPQYLLSPYTAHDRSGTAITGTCPYDMDTSAADATAAEVLDGAKVGVNGQLVTGSMPNRGQVMLVIDDVNDSLTITQGYHDGSGRAYLKGTEVAKLIPSNLKAGVSILGVTGSYAGEPVTAQAKNATPATTSQTILPDTGYDYLSQVVIAAIPKVETLNSAGGYTVTIG